jgi:hypothetical protein
MAGVSVAEEFPRVNVAMLRADKDEMTTTMSLIGSQTSSVFHPQLDF